MAIDLAYDAAMTESERRSLATQVAPICTHPHQPVHTCTWYIGLRLCTASAPHRLRTAPQVSLCLSLVSQPERRGHMALALCFGGTGGGAGAGGGADADAADGAGRSLSLLHAAAKGSLSSWEGSVWWRRPIASASASSASASASSASAAPAPLTLLDLPGAPGCLIYLSPEADAPLETHDVTDADVLVIGGLVDKCVQRGLSLARAAALGVRCRRLPLAENLPRELRGASKSLESLNLTTVLRMVAEWHECGEWPAAIARALVAEQRGASTRRGAAKEPQPEKPPRARDARACLPSVSLT